MSKAKQITCSRPNEKQTEGLREGRVSLCFMCLYFIGLSGEGRRVALLGFVGSLC